VLLVSLFSASLMGAHVHVHIRYMCIYACCKTLSHTTTHLGMASHGQSTAARCSILHHAVTRFNTLQHTAEVHVNVFVSILPSPPCHTYICACIHRYTHTFACIYISAHILVFACTHVQIYMYRIHIYTCMHIYIYKYKSTYAYIYYA